MTDTPLRLFNSLTRQLEPFAPLAGNEARVYTCGPTVYNYQHIGNMRAYIFADTLGRALSFKGYDLKHVINITDVGHLTSDADAGDDKMEKAASAAGKSAWDIAKFYTDAYWRDIERLNIRQPFKWSIATEYVPAMIEFAKGIADTHCYQLDSGLYFDTSTVPNYGKLAGHSHAEQVTQQAVKRAAFVESLDRQGDARAKAGIVAEIITSAMNEQAFGRISVLPGKRNAQDFAIWRTTPLGETRQMEWDSPWGKGAPGWHLECSVMSEALLGLPFDIHTGGIDHREIHHPNEIAQNQAHCHSAETGARIWMHNNFLIDRTKREGAGKMSKSSGEFLTLQALVDCGFHPLAYRMMCLQAHYRSEMEFTWEGLAAAFVRLKRLVMALTTLLGHPSIADLPEDALDLQHRFNRAIDDDLTTPSCIAILEEAVGNDKWSPSIRRTLAFDMDKVLGLGLDRLSRWDMRDVRPASATLTDADIESRLEVRKAARVAKDFATSDRIRDELAAEGVDVMDGDPLGWDWRLDI